MFSYLIFYYHLLFGLNDVMACCVNTLNQFCNNRSNFGRFYGDLSHRHITINLYFLIK